MGLILKKLFGRPKQQILSSTPKEIPEKFMRYFYDGAVLSAVFKTWQNYRRDVEQNKIPAQIRSGSTDTQIFSLCELWDLLSLEIIDKLFTSCPAQVSLLTEVRGSAQLEICSYILNENFPADLIYSYPLKADDLKALKCGIACMYDYLLKLTFQTGAVGGDHDEHFIKFHKGQKITDDFINGCRKLRHDWINVKIEDGLPLELPKPTSLFSVIWADITHKAKYIALACKFGSDFENFAENVGLLEEVKERLQRHLRSYLDAKTPDEVEDY